MCVLSAGAQLLAPAAPHHKAMMFADTTRVGVPFAKDPHVVDFGGRTWLLSNREVLWP